MVLVATFLISPFTHQSESSEYGGLRVYKEKTPNSEYVNFYQIEENDTGFFVTIISKLGDKVHVYKELWLDENYATLRWHYQNHTEKIDISAFRDGNVIRLSGINRGRQVDRMYEIDSLPWKQQFPLDMEGFVTSELESIKFWAIGTHGPADMRIAKFIASKKGRTRIRVNGEHADTMHIHVSFAGVLALIWHGDAWHRLSDGMFLLFNSASAPGHPPTIVELLREI
jgi:hypothetical protein